MKHRRAGARGRALMTAIAATAALTLAIALCGCAAGGTSVSDPRLEGTWHLAAASDHGQGIRLGSNTIILTIGDAEHTGGADPCSSYRATVTGGVGVIFIRARLNSGPRDDCATATLNRIEKQYLDALNGSRFASVDRGSLILTSPDSSLVFVHAAVSVVAGLQNSSWRLYAVPTAVPGHNMEPGLNPVYLSFDTGSGLTIGSACGTFAATYQLEGENFSVGAQRITLQQTARCTTAERLLAAEAGVLLEGPLLIEVSSAGSGDPATLVITNLNEDVPLVWRAAD